ncbi:MAG TPA: hypothetical protein PLR71_14060 [Deltaproteobacteria bacterium]|nr:hypothetical protein [Deltaproteobacteria bacterium]
MRHRAILAGLILVVACAGCGRKLPPLPPERPDPAEIVSMRFEGGQVLAVVRCTVPEATVVLLGKAKGLCPHCTDDLTARQQAVCRVPGEVQLTDGSPESDFMVYRVGVSYGDTRWMTPPRIVVKRR